MCFVKMMRRKPEIRPEKLDYLPLPLPVGQLVFLPPDHYQTSILQAAILEHTSEWPQVVLPSEALRYSYSQYPILFERKNQ